MPNNAHSGWHGIPWHRCDRCGYDFPTSLLQRQNGLILCGKCVDNPSAWTRDAVIRERLSDSIEEPELAPILKQADDTPDYYL